MKKFVLFIVEGKNDEREIQAILRTPFFGSFLEQNVPQFKPLGKDITLDAPGKTSIRSVVSKVVRSWKNGDTAPFQPIKNAYINEIVHVVDLDGVFIPRTAIMKDDDAAGFVYEDELIRAPNPELVVQRNAIKSSNLKVLIETKEIDNLPYRVFYMSCNMDHVLSGKRNANQKYKDAFSFQYGNLCKADPSIIFKSICSGSIGTVLSYEASWQKIMEGTASLKRSTNLNIWLKENGHFEDQTAT